MTTFHVAGLSLNPSSEVPSDIRNLRTLQLARYNSYRLRSPVASELAHSVVVPTYSYVCNVNEPESLSVGIIMRPIIHGGRYSIV